MKRLVGKTNVKNIWKRSARRIFALALAFVFTGTLACEFYNVANNCAFAADDEDSATVGTTYYYKWHRIKSNEDLFKYLQGKKQATNPDVKTNYSNRVLLLYGGDSNGTPNYRLTGVNEESGWYYSVHGEEVQSADCIDGSKDEFTTVSNFNAPFIKYGGTKDGDECIYLRFMPSDTASSYDEAYELVMTDKTKKDASTDGYYYGAMTTKSFDASKIFVYSCKMLAGGTQSADFYPRLVSTVTADAETGHGGGIARTAQMQLKWGGDCPEGTTLLYITRAHLIDACCRWKNSDGDEVWMCYQTTDSSSWFKMYVSTLVEKPAIESSIVFSGTTSNLISSTIIKPGVTIWVKDQAVLRISGTVTNLGEIVIQDGGTVIVDYDTYLTTEATAVKKTSAYNGTNYEAHPGEIRVEKGGQLIVLDGAVVNINYRSGNSMPLTVAQGGSMYLGGALFNQNNTNIYGDLYISETGSIHQGYYMSGTPSNYSKEEYSSTLIFYNTCTLNMEPRGEDEGILQSECCCSVGWDSSDKDHYKKYGGIIWGAKSDWSNATAYMYLYPGITTLTDSSQAGMGTRYSATFDSSGARIYIDQQVSYTPLCVEQFFKGELNAMLNAYYTDSSWKTKYYANDTVYSDPKNINSTVQELYKKATASGASQDVKDAYNLEIKQYYGGSFSYSGQYDVDSESLRTVELDCSGNEKTSC